MPEELFREHPLEERRRVVHEEHPEHQEEGEPIQRHSVGTFLVPRPPEQQVVEAGIPALVELVPDHQGVVAQTDQVVVEQIDQEVVDYLKPKKLHGL